MSEEKYNLVTNNCEHFANECKTGEKVCHQIWTPIEIFVKSITATIGSFFKSPKDSRWLSVIEKLLSMLPKVVKPTKTRIKKLLEKYAANFNPKMAAYIAIVIEAILLCCDACRGYHQGKMSRNECIDVIVTRLLAAATSIPFFLFVNIACGLIPLCAGCIVPVAYIAAIAFGPVADWLGKLAGGLIGKRVVMPMVLWLVDCFESELQEEKKEKEL